jgi:hypothetical protein
VSKDSIQHALMRRGDFHLRRDDRQMFGNYVVLTPDGGSPGPLLNFRRSATFVETPVYDEPKLWRLRIDFATLPEFTLPGSPILAPWVPDNFGGNTIKVTVRQALDRDKQTAVEVFDLIPLHTALTNVQARMPKELFVGQQIGVTVSTSGSSSAPMATQVSLVEVQDEGRDAYGNADIVNVTQSSLSQLFLPANARRRQLIVQNWGSAPLFVAFGQTAGAPGLGALWTVSLPNQGDIYENDRDCYQGDVSGVWTTDDADGLAMVTEGF